MSGSRLESCTDARSVFLCSNGSGQSSVSVLVVWACARLASVASSTGVFVARCSAGVCSLSREWMFLCSSVSRFVPPVLPLCYSCVVCSICGEGRIRPSYAAALPLQVVMSRWPVFAGAGDWRSLAARPCPRVVAQTSLFVALFTCVFPPVSVV